MVIVITINLNQAVVILKQTVKFIINLYVVIMMHIC